MSKLTMVHYDKAGVIAWKGDGDLFVTAEQQPDGELYVIAGHDGDEIVVDGYHDGEDSLWDYAEALHKEALEFLADEE